MAKQNITQVSELWAVIDKKTGDIMMSRGGSSTKSHLMVYRSRAIAVNAVNNRWTKQIINPSDCYVKCIYQSNHNNEGIKK
jgi:hypothetical protein